MRTHMLCLLLLTLALAAGPAAADGFIIPRPLPDVPSPPLLTVKYHHVDVTIRDGAATVSIDQVFHNDFGRELEGIYTFPIPEEAAIQNFTLWVNDSPVTGRILPKDEARRIYEGYVRRRIDPALLEYVGRDAFQARVFPIPANGDRRVEIKYSQPVPFDNGVYAFRYPLDTERFSAKPLQDVAVRVTVDSRVPLKAVYSPSHNIDVQRRGDNHAVISYEEKNVRPDKDLRLYFGVSEAEFGLNLLTYSPGLVEQGRTGQGGFFMAMLAPKTGLEERARLAKDVTFVLDTSGSMSGEKIEQARKALRFVLEHLSPNDRFNLLTFSGDVEPFRPKLVQANAEEIAAARKFVDGIDARGGTNINDALQEALKEQEPRAGVPSLVVFLTDGQPTIGTTDVKQILGNVGKGRIGETRIFVFGVGDDVNTHLLDRISGENGGASDYVRPQEDLEVKVSSFYTKVATPVLAGLKIDFGDADVYDVYPKQVSDLFAGTQVLVLGRYRHPGRVNLTLSGSVGGDRRTFTYPADFAGEEKRADFVPRLWATRKVATLLDEIRLNGYNKELVDEVTRLGMEYGIVTPYTSALVEEEPRPVAGAPVPLREARERLDAMSNALPGGGGMRGGAGGAPAKSTPPVTAGPAAVSAAQDIQAGKQAERAGDRFQSVRHVEGKTFRLTGGVWTDTAYQAEMKKRPVAFASDEYFALVAKEPKLAKYFALGEKVIVVWNGEAISVAP